MPGHHASYPPDFRARMVELAPSGRTPEEFAVELEPQAGAARTWVKRGDLDMVAARSRAFASQECLACSLIEFTYFG